MKPAKPVLAPLSLPKPSRSSSTSSNTSNASASTTNTTSSALSPTSSAGPSSAASNWDAIMAHSHSRPCGGTLLGSRVKGPCKPIGRTDGVAICWWCSRWLGTFNTGHTHVKPRFASVYEWEEDEHDDAFYA